MRLTNKSFHRIDSANGPTALSSPTPAPAPVVGGGVVAANNNNNNSNYYGSPFQAVGETSLNGKTHSANNGGMSASGSKAAGGRLTAMSVAPRGARREAGNTMRVLMRPRAQPADGSRVGRREDRLVSGAVEAEAGPNASLASSLTNTITAAMNTFTEQLPAIQSAYQQPVVLAALVVLFFAFVMVFLQLENYNAQRFLHQVQANRNDQRWMLSSSLTHIATNKSAELMILRQPYRRTPPAIVEKKEEELASLQRQRNQAVDALHRELRYPGPREDIEFLVEEHVAYEARVRSVAEEELAWLTQRATTEDALAFAAQREVGLSVDGAELFINEDANTMSATDESTPWYVRYAAERGGSSSILKWFFSSSSSASREAHRSFSVAHQSTPSQGGGAKSVLHRAFIFMAVVLLLIIYARLG